MNSTSEEPYGVYVNGIFKYILVEGDKGQDTLFIQCGDEIISTIHDFKNGDLGIDLVKDLAIKYGREKNPYAKKPGHDPNFYDLAKGWYNRDPLALDLDGDGFETVGAEAGIVFDYVGDGLRKGTGWLVFDRNEDGQINNGSELFGDSTDRYEGQGKCVNAFEALSQEDSNGDGMVDRHDDNWSRLQVWRDLNQDGLSQANELFSLDELSITSHQP